jgi:ABC-type transporter Mla MlaB component
MTLSPRASVTLQIDGPLQRADLPGLFARTCALLEGAGPELLCCELGDIEADAVAVDALARLALAARRHGARVLIHGASLELRELIALMGLGGVLEVSL